MMAEKFYFNFLVGLSKNDIKIVKSGIKYFVSLRFAPKLLRNRNFR